MTLNHTDMICQCSLQSFLSVSIAELEDREGQTLGLHNSGMEPALCTSTRVTNTVNTVLLAPSENLKKWLS